MVDYSYPLSPGDAEELPVFCQTCQVKGTSVCADLSSGEITKLQARMSSTDYSKGDTISHQGDEVTNLRVITHGTLKLYKVLEDGRQQITGFTHPGDFLGVAPGSTLQVNVEALTEVRVCVFPHATLAHLSNTYPGITKRLVEKANTELTKAYDHMLLLGQKTVHERVASFFTALADQTGKPAPGEGPDAWFVPLPMPRRDIADYLALRSETLSRVLKDLRSDGLIRDVTRQKLLVPSLAELRSHTLLEID